MPFIFRVRACQKRHHIGARAMGNPCLGPDNLIAAIGFFRPCRQTGQIRAGIGLGENGGRQ